MKAWHDVSKLSCCSSCHAIHSDQTGKGEAFGPVQQQCWSKGGTMMDSLLAKMKRLSHEKRCRSEGGTTMDKR